MLSSANCDKCGKTMVRIVTIGCREDEVGHFKALQCEKGGCNRLWNAALGYRDVEEFYSDLKLIPLS